MKVSIEYVDELILANEWEDLDDLAEKLGVEALEEISTWPLECLGDNDCSYEFECGHYADLLYQYIKELAITMIKEDWGYNESLIKAMKKAF